MGICSLLSQWGGRTLLVLAALVMPAVALGFQTAGLIPNGNGFYSGSLINNWGSNDLNAGVFGDVDEGPGCTANAFNDFWVRILSGSNARQSATLNIGSIPDGTTITGIAITVCARAGGTFRTFTRIGGSDSDAAADMTASILPLSGTVYTQNISLNVAKAAGTAVEVGVRKGNNTLVSFVNIGTLSAVLSYRATPTLSVTNSPVTYNGSPQAAVLQANSDVPAPNTVVPGVFSDVRYDGSTTVPTNAGAYAVTADFAPTSTTDYASLDDAPAGNFVIDPATTTTTITSDTPDPSLVNQPVVVNYTVVVNAPGAGTPTGNVTVTVAGPVNNNSCTATVGDGTCTLPGTDFPQPGSYTLTATYAGDSNFSTSFDIDLHQVNAVGPGGVAGIPTLQEWALMLFGLLLGGLVWRQSQRKGRMAA